MRSRWSAALLGAVGACVAGWLAYGGGAEAGSEPNRVIRPCVLLLIFDPILEASGHRRLHEALGFRDPDALTDGYIRDVRQLSHNLIDYQVVQRVLLDEFPVKKDGFRYDDAGFIQAWRSRKGFHQPDAVDYHAILKRFDVASRVNRGEIDEVWIQGMPYSGLWESTMAGKGAYFCNSDPVPGVAANRIFVVMGFNYERGVGEMLENLGHRTESIMRRVYGSWEPYPTHAWNRFTLYDRVAPGRAGCGNVHFAPNSTRDYEWGNKTPVFSTADDWLNYPRLTGAPRLVTAVDWGGGEIRAHHRWWFTRLPHSPGRGPDGKLANWWKYVIDFNRYRESR